MTPFQKAMVVLIAIALLGIGANRVYVEHEKKQQQEQKQRQGDAFDECMEEDDARSVDCLRESNSVE